MPTTPKPSETEPSFTSDLFALHAELASIDFIKKSEGDTGARKYKYQDLPSLMSQAVPVLHKHNFVWYTRPGYTNGEPTLHYALLHKNGEGISGEMLLQLKSADPQGQGSAITYARRYSFTAVNNIVADEDDDGAKAVESNKAQEDVNRAKYIRFIETASHKLNKDTPEMDNLSTAEITTLAQKLNAELTKAS